MLDMRPECERCGKALPADSEGALICSFECTFCIDCDVRELGGLCPNCSGVLTSRPKRTGAALEAFPARAKA
jgi:hypothetical protein